MKRITLCMMVLLGAVVLTGCSQQVKLFNGQDLDGWDMYLADSNVDPADVWSVENGVIHCKGKPNGYIRTKKEYSDYKLHVEWRWVGKPTNSGVLVHTIGDDVIWPRCIEAQLKHKSAGDFVTMQDGTAITVAGERHTSTSEKKFKGISKQKESSENPPGQWNSYDIVCKGDTITLTVNGILQNTGTESTRTSGAICLQSEGGPIEFRNIKLSPLK